MTAQGIRGFTLIEILTVLLIMGLLVGLASAIAYPDDRRLLRLEAARLAQLLELAANESQLTGRAIAWTTDGSSYRFWWLSADTAWFEIRDLDLLRARTLPQGMTISGAQVENMQGPGSMRLEFPPHGLALSFNIEMSLGTLRYTVAASPIGEIQVLPGEGSSRDELSLR